MCTPFPVLFTGEVWRSPSISDEKYLSETENWNCLLYGDSRSSDRVSTSYWKQQHTNTSIWKGSSVRGGCKALSWEQISNDGTIKPKRAYAFLSLSVLGLFSFFTQAAADVQSLSSLINAASHDQSIHRFSPLHTPKAGNVTDALWVSMRNHCLSSCSFTPLISPFWLHKTHKHTHTQACVHTPVYRKCPLGYSTDTMHSVPHLNV